MTEQTTDTHPKRSRPARIALIATGAIAGLAALSNRPYRTVCPAG